MMPDRIVNYHEPVLLLGGGAVHSHQILRVQALTNRIVAADGGANMAHAEGLSCDLVIGDMDSVRPDVLATIPKARHIRVAEQETTDFEKCLTRIGAPLIIGLGFMGPRADHALAAMGALVRHAAVPCILVGESDLVFAAPAHLRLEMEAGTRVSLFPMAQVKGVSKGLRWPIDGLEMAPNGRVGTSNEASGPVELRFYAPGMLVVLPAEALEVAAQALMARVP